MKIIRSGFARSDVKAKSELNKFMTETFTTMQYDRKHLVIRNAPDKKPLVIAECYLPEIAETICTALTELQNKNDETENSEAF